MSHWKCLFDNFDLRTSSLKLFLLSSEGVPGATLYFPGKIETGSPSSYTSSSSQIRLWLGWGCVTCSSQKTGVNMAFGLESSRASVNTHVFSLALVVTFEATCWHNRASGWQWIEVLCSITVRGVDITVRPSWLSSRMSLCSVESHPTTALGARLHFDFSYPQYGTAIPYFLIRDSYHCQRKKISWQR